MLRKIEGRREEMTEDEMVEWHHRLNRHEFEQTPGDGEEQRNLACYSSWGHKVSDMTEQLNNNNTLGGISFSPLKIGNVQAR